MARMTLLYFASLRERAGLERELVDSAARTLAELYDEAQDKHALGWPRSHLRVAVDDLAQLHRRPPGYRKKQYTPDAVFSCITP